MEEKRIMQRLPLNFPCEIGKLNKEINQWEFSEELVCNIHGKGILLETNKDLAVDECIKLNLRKRSWHRYKEGYVKLLCILGFEDLYIKAKVVRTCKSEVNEIRRFGLKLKDILFKWKYYTSKRILNERKEERRKGERRITEKGLLEHIECAVELGLKNVIFRSGTYHPSSTRNNTKGTRRMFDRRVLIPVRVYDTV
jgi:hypothetical protein